MASSDPAGLYIFALIVIVIIAVIAYSYLNQRLSAKNRKELIKKFKAAPAFAKDAPVLVHGRAGAPDLVLPTTGEHVAFYSLFIMTRETAITDTHTHGTIRINGFGLGQDTTRIDSVKGFMFNETSGDFSVTAGGKTWTVKPTSVFAYIKKGADMVSGLVAGQFKSAGLPEIFFQDHMNFTIAQQALSMLCGFDAPLITERSQRKSGSWNTTTTGRSTVSVVTATSRIDSRIHYYVTGVDLPQGILDLIAKRGIELPEKEQIIVVETYIPPGREVYVFGTFDGDRAISYADSTVQLSVSYADPESF